MWFMTQIKQILFFEYFLNEKNKTVSLYLLYNLSKFLNKKLNLEQIKTFLN